MARRLVKVGYHNIFNDIAHESTRNPEISSTILSNKYFPWVYITHPPQLVDKVWHCNTNLILRKTRSFLRGGTNMCSSSRCWNPRGGYSLRRCRRQSRRCQLNRETMLARLQLQIVLLRQGMVPFAADVLTLDLRTEELKIGDGRNRGGEKPRILRSRTFMHR